MKRSKVFFLFFFIIIKLNIFSNNSYFEYYRIQEIADSLIYIEQDYEKGFKIYQEIYKKFDFIWIEDCLRICQVAIITKNNEMALLSIKKAIDNGLELDKLKFINQGCQCNYYKNFKNSVSILDSFIIDNKQEIIKYYKKNRLNYLKNINRSHLVNIIVNHVDDELYKCEKEVMKPYNINFAKKWKDILDNNYNYVKNNFDSSSYFGCRNLGNYSETLMSELKLDSFSINNLKNSYYTKFNMSEEKHGKYYRLIPSIRDEDYFLGSPLYITFYHDIERFHLLLKKHYKNLIDKGYLHPREFILLAYKANELKVNPCIQPSDLNKCMDFFSTNKIRKKNYLPSIEIDIAKHNFAHKYNLHLFFGFISSTR